MPSTLVTQAIEQELRKAHQGGRFDGVALVAQRDQVIYEGAFGIADRKRNKLHTLSAPFPICSITKQFTALLVMQQVAAGKLRLDGVITDYLPWFARQLGGKIQLRHLLMHTSGLLQLDDVRGFYAQKDIRLTEPEHVVRTIVMPGKPLSAPGATFRYNNADYLVLAAILEAVTRQPYADLLQARILRPLGMSHTGLITPQHPRLVTGYLTEKNRLVPEPAVRLENFGAAGAMYSTVGDLLSWDRALDADRLLERKWREVMFTSDPSKGYVAFGTWVYSYLPYGGKTPTLYERQGAIGGLHCQNLRVPEDGYSVILLANIDVAPLEAYSGKGLPNKILSALYNTKETA